MPTKEVDETQFNSAMNVVRSVAEIMKDPKRKMRLLELQKEAEPNAQIPEYDAMKASHDAISEVTKKMDELKTELQSDREKRENDKKLAEFQDKYEKGRAYLQSRGYQDDGVKAIEKMMEERGIADHEDALVVYEKLHPPQAPVRSAGLSNFLNHARMDDSDELTKQLIASKGDDGFVLDRMIDAVRREGQ